MKQKDKEILYSVLLKYSLKLKSTYTVLKQAGDTSILPVQNDEAGVINPLCVFFMRHVEVVGQVVKMSTLPCP